MEKRSAKSSAPALPVPLTSFLGREQDTATLVKLLRRPDVRLVSLNGPGGVGKTRVALAVAAALREDFADRVYFVSLAATSDAQHLLATIAQAFKLKPAKNRPIAELLESALQQRDVLLVLDNFEQLLPAAPVLMDLLTTCCALKLLVTSRSVLHLYPEHCYSVTPLAYPNPHDLPAVDELNHYPALELFIQRARAIKPHLTLDPTDMHAIAGICARLDGLPLAIELAAARVKLLSPQALLPQLEHPLDLLTQGGRDMPDRQQTLRATLTWSFNLLTTDEQRLFRRLAVFSGGCTLEAGLAISMTAGDCGASFLDLVTSLVDKSLLQVEDQEAHTPRLRMLDTVRDYALEYLATSGELDLIQQAHAAYYLALAEDAEPQLYGAQQYLWRDRLEQDNENLRAALRFFFAQDDWEHGVRLTGALAGFWCMQGRLTEGLTWAERALQTRHVQPRLPIERHVLYAAGLFATYLGQRERAACWLRESSALCGTARDVKGFVKVARVLIQLLLAGGDVGAAQSLAQKTVELAQTATDPWILAAVQNLSGTLHLCLGDVLPAQAALQRSAALFAEAGDLYMHEQMLLVLQNTTGAPGEDTGPRPVCARPPGTAEEEHALWPVSWLLCASGSTALLRGDWAHARHSLEQARALFQRMADKPGMARSLSLLAHVALHEQDAATVRRLALESLKMAGSIADAETIAACLAGVADIVAQQGQARWAAQLWGAASRYHEAAPTQPTVLPPAERMQLLHTAQQSLGADAYETAWAAGRVLTWDQVLVPLETVATSAAHIGITLPASDCAAELPPPAGLTRREFEILRLVVEGCSNAAIAERLSVSNATVRGHLYWVYRKLGVSSRTEAMRYAIDHHLL